MACLSGQMCPGRRKLPGEAAGSASSRSVSARSSALMPVEIPSRASTVTVKAVYMASSFSALDTCMHAPRFLHVSVCCRKVCVTCQNKLCSSLMTVLNSVRGDRKGHGHQ